MFAVVLVYLGSFASARLVVSGLWGAIVSSRYGDDARGYMGSRFGTPCYRTMLRKRKVHPVARAMKSLGLTVDFPGLRNTRAEQPRWFAICSSLGEALIVLVALPYLLAQIDVQPFEGADALAVFGLSFLGALVAARLLTNGLWWAMKSFRHRREQGDGRTGIAHRGTTGTENPFVERRTSAAPEEPLRR